MSHIGFCDMSLKSDVWERVGYRDTEYNAEYSLTGADSAAGVQIVMKSEGNVCYRDATRL